MLYIVCFKPTMQKKKKNIGQTGKINARVCVHKQQTKDPNVRYTPQAANQRAQLYSMV